MTILMHSFNEDFNELVSVQPDKVAILDKNKQVLTYRELSIEIAKAQTWLMEIGMCPGDTLIALMPNAIETAIVFLACIRGGFTYAPLPCTSTITEVKRWKSITKAQHCILAKIISASLQKEINEIDWQVNTVGIGDEEKNWENCKVDDIGSTPGNLIMASSGSTGEPKAMLLDGNRLWSSAKAFLRYHDVQNNDVRFWNYLPMSYLGGLFNLLMIPLAAGGSILIDEAFNGKTFLTFWGSVQRFNITAVWLVPTILRGLLMLSESTGIKRIQHNLKHCYLGTAPISLREKNKFSEIFNIQPLENYGLSETTFICSESLNTVTARKEGSVGSIMPDIEIKLKITQGTENELAEIWVCTPYIMKGYLGTQGLLEPELDAEGFFNTGDFGQLIDDQLIISGRKRDIIKKGGILVSLREIELVAESYEIPVEAAAVSIDHPFYGESCILYVSTGEAIDRTALLANLTVLLHSQLAQHKWPEKVIFLENFPRTSSGKIQKHLLQNMEISHVQ